jgi:hypothetical protein
MFDDVYRWHLVTLDKRGNPRSVFSPSFKGTFAEALEAAAERADHQLSQVAVILVSQPRSEDTQVAVVEPRALRALERASGR